MFGSHSRANDHICSSLEWFAVYERIPTVFLKLLNGSMATTEIAGIVSLGGAIMLTDTLTCICAYVRLQFTLCFKAHKAMVIFIFFLS